MNDTQIIIYEVNESEPLLKESLNSLSLQLSASPQLLTDEDLYAMFVSPTTHLFLAKNKESNSIVGMITLVTFRTPYKMKGTIEDFVVDQASRGQKVGENLLQRVLQKARDEGVKSLTLTSHPTREAANHLYQSVGFERRDTNVYRITL